MAAAGLIARSTTRRHRDMLLISLAVIALAGLLEVRADQRVFVRGFPAWPLPEMCASRTWLHVECPGCGLTRSFVYLAHSDLNASWRMHRLGWLLALAVVAQLPYRLLGLATGNSAPLGTTFPRLCAWTLVVLLLVNWLVNLLARFAANL